MSKNYNKNKRHFFWDTLYIMSYFFGRFMNQCIWKIAKLVYKWVPISHHQKYYFGEKKFDLNFFWKQKSWPKKNFDPNFFSDKKNLTQIFFRTKIFLIQIFLIKIFFLTNFFFYPNLFSGKQIWTQFFLGFGIWDWGLGTWDLGPKLLLTNWPFWPIGCGPAL